MTLSAYCRAISSLQVQASPPLCVLDGKQPLLALNTSNPVNIMSFMLFVTIHLLTLQLTSQVKPLPLCLTYLTETLPSQKLRLQQLPLLGIL